MDKNLEADKQPHDFSYTEAKDLLNKLENWMRTTNETLKTLIIKTDNLKIDIFNLDSRLKKLEKNDGKLIVVR